MLRWLGAVDHVFRMSDSTAVTITEREESCARAAARYYRERAGAEFEPRFLYSDN